MGGEGAERERRERGALAKIISDVWDANSDRDPWQEAAEATLAQSESAVSEALARHDQAQIVVQMAKVDEARARADLIVHRLPPWAP